MTAEIAVLNKYGIALAADSAVSIGEKKVYKSANKLFALTKKYPVGVMVYGNSQFMGIPWETLIKFYRKNLLKDRQLPTVAAYRDDFLNFLSSSEIFGEEGEADFVRGLAASVLIGLLNNLRSRAKQEITEHGKISSAENVRLVDSVIEEWFAEQEKEPAKFPRGMKAAFKKRYASDIQEIAEGLLERLPISKGLMRRLHNVMLDAFGRKINVLSPSGIVIAGFGQTEMFPSIASVRLDGKVGRHLRILSESEQAVSYDRSAVIVPFAQREMVDMFMKGVDPKLHHVMKAEIKQGFTKIQDFVLEAAGEALTGANKRLIKKEIARLGGELTMQFESIQRRRFVEPVLDSVAALPLDELAAMAESLVNLTTFKRRVTPVPESVGGPVDVAVISKGDGFVWIKRKHYFSPDLNPHFFQ